MNHKGIRLTTKIEADFLLPQQSLLFWKKEKIVLFRQLSFLNCVIMRAIRTLILLFSDLSG